MRHMDSPHPLLVCSSSGGSAKQYVKKLDSDRPDIVSISSSSSPPLLLPTRSEKHPLGKTHGLRKRANENLHPSLVAFDVGDDSKRFYVHTGILCKHSESLSKVLHSSRDVRKRKIALKGVDVKTFGRFVQFLYDGRYDFPKASHIDNIGKIDDWLEKSADARKAAVNVNTADKQLREVPRKPQLWERLRFSRAARFFVPPAFHEGKEAYILKWADVERIAIYNEIGRPDSIYLDFSPGLSAHAELYYLAVRLGLSDLQLFTLTHIAYTLLAMLPLVELSQPAKESFLSFIKDTFTRVNYLGQKTGLKVLCVRYWGLFRPKLQLGMGPVESHLILEIESNEEFMFIYFGELGWIVKALGSEKDFGSRSSTGSLPESTTEPQFRYPKAFLPVHLDDFVHLYGAKLGSLKDNSLLKLQAGREKIRQLLAAGYHRGEEIVAEARALYAGEDGALDLEKGLVETDAKAGDLVQTDEAAASWRLRKELSKWIDCSLQELCSDSE